MQLLFTQKMEMFCQKYIEIDNATEAHSVVYGGISSRMTHKREAFALKRNPLIIERIRELRGMAAEKYLITVEIQTAKLEKIREAAFKAGDYSPAISAVMGQSKHYGLLVDKAESKSESTNINYNVEFEMTNEDREMLRRIRGEE